MPAGVKMCTDLLYYRDPSMLSFEALVIEHTRHKGRPSVILDESAFYPESGGQLADHGRIDGTRVIDVQLDERYRLHHVIEGPIPDLGAVVHGEIDRARRRLHMAIHTGQHILSQAVLQTASAATVSSRLGASECTVDLRSERLDESNLNEAEELANAVIEDDLEIRARFVDPEELETLTLRRSVKVEGDVRVVEIGDFDCTPCGGTHCTRTSQVGLVSVRSMERYKGLWRVTFDSGRRARAHLAKQQELLKGLARELSCSPEKVRDALSKLQREKATLKDRLHLASELLVERLAPSLLTGAEDLDGDEDLDGARAIVASFPGAVADLLRTFSRRLCGEPGVVCFLAGTGDDHTQVLVARAEDAAYDCGAFLKRAAAVTGGRGGGRPNHAEGRLPAGLDWSAVVSENA